MYCVGKVLGVDDEFNLCSGSLIECKEYCNDILVCDSEKNSSGIFVWMTSCNFFLKLRVFRPAMIDVSKPEKDLASHLLNGMHLFNPAIDPEAYLHWTRRVFGSVSNEKIPKITSFFSRWEYTKSYRASFVQDHVLFPLLLFWPYNAHLGAPKYFYFTINEWPDEAQHLSCKLPQRRYCQKELQKFWNVNEQIDIMYLCSLFKSK